MKQTGLNMETVKKKNRSSILRLINREGPISKKDIAEKLSLTPAAVTQICSEFMESGLLEERGVGDEEVVRAGRKKVLIDINPVYCFIYGINIDSERTTVALCNLKGEALGTKTLATKVDVAPEHFLEKIGSVCETLRGTCGVEMAQIAGAGVGIPGIVDKKQAKSIHAYGIWEKPVAVGEILEKVLQIPVKLQNNVNAFAAAELLFGMGRMHENLMLVKWGPGVGCSLIIDQRVYEGARSKAAELGHFIVEKDGALCGCGRRGCLETRVSVAALQKKVPGFPDRVEERKSPELLEAVDLLARSIVNAATILAPRQIVLYGRVFSQSWLRKLLMESCEQYDESFGNDRICYSALAEKEAYIGPVAYFIQEEIF